VREAGLDLQVAPLERVVVRVGDRGIVLLVIADVVPGDLVGQAGQLVGGFSFGEVGDVAQIIGKL
jgi:hypothetical protein